MTEFRVDDGVSTLEILLANARLAVEVAEREAYFLRTASDDLLDGLHKRRDEVFVRGARGSLKFVVIDFSIAVVQTRFAANLVEMRRIVKIVAIIFLSRGRRRIGVSTAPLQLLARPCALHPCRTPPL